MRGLVIAYTAIACKAVTIEDPNGHQQHDWGSPVRRCGHQATSCGSAIKPREFTELCLGACAPGLELIDENATGVKVLASGKTLCEDHREGRLTLTLRQVMNHTAASPRVSLFKRRISSQPVLPHTAPKSKLRTGWQRKVLGHKLLWQRSRASFSDHAGLGSSVPALHHMESSVTEFTAVFTTLYNSSFVVTERQEDVFLVDSVALPGVGALLVVALTVAGACTRYSNTCRPSDDDEEGSELPCGLTENEVFDLLNRDITPDDYDLLLRLDDAPDDEEDTDIFGNFDSSDSFESVSDNDLRDGECVVCLNPFQSGSHVVALRCHHHFHESCISKWFSVEGQRACPLCRADVVESV